MYCVRSVSWKLFQIFRWNFTQMQNIMRRGAEHKNSNSCKPTFGDTALWTLKILISVIYLCPLCNLKTVEIFSWNFMQMYITMIQFADEGGGHGAVLAALLLSPTFSKKSGGTLFSAFRGAWFRNFSRYFVPLTPPTVFVQSFWNLTGAFKMVWRYACVFFGES